MPKYTVLDKDTIKSEIMPYLSIAKRGFSSKFDLVEIMNAILYKLKSGCQWRMLPIGHLFSGEFPSWDTVFHHYRKWSVKEEWEKIYSNIMRKNKSVLDLSISHIDGSHTPAFRGGGRRLIIKAVRSGTLPTPYSCPTIREYPLQCPSRRPETTQTSMK